MESDRISGFGMRAHLSAGDWSAAALVAGLVLILLILWPFPMPHPCVWDDLAAAASIKPQVAEFPALAPLVSRIFFEHFGTVSGFAAFVFFGHVVAAATAALWYMVFRQLLEFTSRLDMADRVWNDKLCPLLAGLGALLVAFSETVWISSQTFTSSSVDLFLAALALALFFRFIARGRRHLGFLSMLVLGVLAGETPFGVALLLPVGALSVFSWWMIDARDDIDPPIRFPPIEEFPWVLVAAGWVVGFAGTIAIADSSFRAVGGNPGDFHSAFTAWKGLLSAGTTVKGALLGMLVTWLPLSALVVLCPWLTHPFPRKPWFVRGLVLVLGLAAATQFSDVAAWRFRNWTGEPEAVAGTVLPGFYQAAAAAAVMLSASVFAAMGWCHENRLPMLVVRLGRFLMVLALLAFAGHSAFTRQCEVIRVKLAKVDEHLVKTLEACKGNDEVASQGGLDVVLEFRARLENRKLKIVDEK